MFWSTTARTIMARHYGVQIGAYSYGECFVPGMMPPGTTVGRYVSMAAGVRVFVRNHPMERLSLHPFFYNHKLGFVDRDTIESGTLEIGHESWIGERAILTPGCRRIGIGAVVGAGAVVTKDVPDFAIVGGNPAKVLRLRFDEAIAARLISSRWWERSVSELVPYLSDLLAPVDRMAIGHPLFKAPA
jgi:virginiamycin A acetyltransferase